MTEEMWTKPEGLMEHHQSDQYMYCGTATGQEEEKGREIIWRDSGQNLSNFDERCEYKYLSSPVNTK